MYRKSFFIIALSLIFVGIISTGPEMVSALPGMPGPPSKYDKGLTVMEAFNTSEHPLLIEFYSDSCKTCRYVTPILAGLESEFEDELTFVMVDVTDVEQQQVVQLFSVDVIPSIYVFDFKHMNKQEVDIQYFENRTLLQQGIESALTTVQKEVKQAS